MSEITNILNKVLVKEFYRLNIGFFLVVGTLAFGFMSGAEHRALAEFFVSSPFLLLIPVGVWVIYFLNIISFNRQQLTRNENQFLFDMNVMPVKEKWSTLSWTITLQLLPAILYGTFLLIIGLTHELILSGILILLSLGIMIFTGTIILVSHLHKPNQDVRVTFLKKFLDIRFTKPLIQFYLEWLLRREPIAVLATKIFTCFLTFGVLILYETENYDWRLMAMGLTLSFCSNMMLIFHIHQFENIHFSILRALPIHLIKRLLLFTGVFALICLPEISILIKRFPPDLSFNDFWQVIFFGLSIGLAFYASLYLPHNDLETFGRIVFLVIMLWIVIILFKVPLWLLSLINLIAGGSIFVRSYYAFEHSSDGSEKHQ